MKHIYITVVHKHTHTHTYIYIYIYIYVRVCVCVLIKIIYFSSPDYLYRWSCQLVRCQMSLFTVIRDFFTDWSDNYKAVILDFRELLESYKRVIRKFPEFDKSLEEG